jgi:hypothetical protein
MSVLPMVTEEHLKLADWPPDDIELAVRGDNDLPPLPAIRATVEVSKMRVFR